MQELTRRTRCVGDLQCEESPTDAVSAMWRSASVVGEESVFRTRRRKMHHRGEVVVFLVSMLLHNHVTLTDDAQVRAATSRLEMRGCRKPYLK